MDEKIQVLVYKPLIEPYTQEIPNTLEAQQQLVGGYIEAVGLGKQVYMICNEEGKFEGLPANRFAPFLSDIIVGNFFITKIDDEGNNVSIDQKDIDYAKEFFK